MGNYHARFLEGWGRETVPGYSAPLQALSVLLGNSGATPAAISPGHAHRTTPKVGSEASFSGCSGRNRNLKSNDGTRMGIGGEACRGYGGFEAWYAGIAGATAFSLSARANLRTERISSGALVPRACSPIHISSRRAVEIFIRLRSRVSVSRAAMRRMERVKAARRARPTSGVHYACRMAG